MNFYSWLFFFFCLSACIIYWLPVKTKHYKNLILFAASFAFYGWAHPLNTAFLGLIILISYTGGLIVSRSASKITLALFIIVSALPLAVFKYAGYIGKITHSPSINNEQLLRWLVPIGMSFITFACIGYMVDCYRKTINVEKNLLTYSAYISFFPHLLSGPIPDAKTILPQFDSERKFAVNGVHEGASLIAWGLFKKLVIADNINLAANYCFAHYDNLAGSTLFCGVLLFGFQIYADFSGYSDLMKGIAKFFGIEIHWNFKLPFFSRNPREFWRKWHISLNHWLKNYIYLPLGGRSSNKAIYIFAVLFTFTFSGLWHGSNSTFVIWGFVNGCLFLPYYFAGQLKSYKEPVAAGKYLPSIKEFFLVVITFNLINLTRVFFKSNSIEQAFGYYDKMFSAGLFSKPTYFIFKELKWCLLLIVIEWFQRERKYILDTPLKNSVLRWVPVLICIGLTLLLHRKFSLQEHYYFRF
jgi:alginate O-acetyltransferase complex protein AlgI